MVGAAALVLLALLAVVVLGPGRSGPTDTPATGARLDRQPRSGAPVSIGRVETSALASSLPAPLSREAALALGQREVLLLGGLTSADTSSSGVAVLDTATGTVSTVGTLAIPTHDAGGAISGHQALLFGGGQATSVATVESFPTAAAGPGAASTSTAAQVVGTLPSARSDDVAVSVGRTTYVVGGYDGTVGEPGVLATSNGRSFRTVATLPVPVRYPAVAALDGLLYVFGGEAVSGPQAGQPVADLQVVDPARHTARVAGYLSRPLEGAAAVVLGGQIYVAGGDSSATTGAAASGTPVTVPTVWRFDPRRGTTTVVAHLPVPISNAGVAVSGTTAWLVGGETDGTVRAVVQRISVVHP